MNHNEGLHLRDVIELNGRVISFKITDGNHEITLRDSLCIFANQGLGDLTKEFDVEHKKLDELVDKNMHKQITYDNFNDYKDKVEPYLFNDCHGLLEVILKFGTEVYADTGINLSEVFTGATLAKKQLYKNYYNSFTNPIYFLSKQKDAFIRSTYYGGRNECFCLGSFKGKYYYYDFTSLYPAVGRRYLPYNEPRWETLNGHNDFRGFFGFTEVYVMTIDYSRKPIHAMLKKCGNSQRLLFPYIKKWTKLTLFSEEIRLGIKEGVYAYKFDDCKGIRFGRKPIFYDIFTDCFNRKAKATELENNAIAQVYKIIANSLYGCMGLRANDRESIVFGNKEDINCRELLEQGRLINRCEIPDSPYTTLTVSKDLEMKDYNVAIASAITAYGRMRLWHLIDTIEKAGLEVMYCDTDSVITNCDITKHPNIMKEFCWDGTGEALGSLKNEALAKIVKRNKKTLNKCDIEQQKKVDGGDLSFDEVHICGCKFYACKKTLHTGDVLQITKIKGFKESDESPLKFDYFEDLCSNKIEKITQVQEQWSFPKTSFVNEVRNCGLNITKV
jgi:hypothetical protein